MIYTTLESSRPPRPEFAARFAKVKADARAAERRFAVVMKPGIDPKLTDARLATPAGRARSLAELEWMGREARRYQGAMDAVFVRAIRIATAQNEMRGHQKYYSQRSEPETVVSYTEMSIKAAIETIHRVEAVKPRFDGRRFVFATVWQSRLHAITLGRVTWAQRQIAIERADLAEERRSKLAELHAGLVARS